MLWQSIDVEENLKHVALKLQNLLSAVWTRDDSRFEPAIDLLKEAVWQAHDFPFGEELIRRNGDQLHNLTSNMQGRVLTVIEMLFPEGRQCQAIKQKASSHVWDFYHTMIGLDIEKNVEPEPFIVSGSSETVE